MGTLKKWSATLLACSVLGACAVPRLNAPTENGYPSLRTIVDRITCEMVNMIRHDNFDEFGFRNYLVTSDYVASMQLSLSTTETGSLAPRLNFPSVGTNVSVGVGLLSSRSRTQKFSRNMRFSFRELYDRLQEDTEFGRCPGDTRTGLAGELGIKNIVRLQNTARTTLTSGPSGKSEDFAGTISFSVVRSIDSTGPTWVLSNFVGPGGFGSLQKTSLNKLIIAFAPGSTPADRAAERTRSDFLRADEVLRNEIISQID